MLVNQPLFDSIHSHFPTFLASQKANFVSKLDTRIQIISEFSLPVKSYYSSYSLIKNKEGDVYIILKYKSLPFEDEEANALATEYKIRYAFSVSHSELLIDRRRKCGEISSFKTESGYDPTCDYDKEKTALIALQDIPQVINVLGFYSYKNEKNISKKGMLIKWCNQGDLLKRILDTENPLSLNQKRYIAEELLDGFREMHRRGISHRDIKPENVLMHNNRPFISDFGFADHITNLVHDWTSGKGSIYAIAPEMFGEDRTLRFSTKSDVWAFGVLLHALFTGTYPSFTAHLERITEFDEGKYRLTIHRYRRKEPMVDTIEHVIWQIFNPNVQQRPEFSEIILPWPRYAFV